MVCIGAVGLAARRRGRLLMACTAALCQLLAGAWQSSPDVMHASAHVGVSSRKCFSSRVDPDPRIYYHTLCNIAIPWPDQGVRPEQLVISAPCRDDSEGENGDSDESDTLSEEEEEEEMEEEVVNKEDTRPRGKGKGNKANM